MDKKITKIEEAAAIERLMQVYEMNINIPENNIVSRKFYDSLLSNTRITPVIDGGKTVIKGVHINDAIGTLMDSFDYFNSNDDGGGMIIITTVLSIFNTFKNVRFVDFTFTVNPELMGLYEKIVDVSYDGDKIEMFNRIYDINTMEMHLCDSLDVKVVDFLNKMFIFFGYIPNDYMKRRFTIEFEYDEYVSFMEMVFTNNHEFVEIAGPAVVNFLILFPVVVTEKKPRIRVVTNYYDL